MPMILLPPQTPRAQAIWTMKIIVTICILYEISLLLEDRECLDRQLRLVMNEVIDIVRYVRFMWEFTFFTLLIKTIELYIVVASIAKYVAEHSYYESIQALQHYFTVFIKKLWVEGRFGDPLSDAAVCIYKCITHVIRYDIGAIVSDIWNVGKVIYTIIYSLWDLCKSAYQHLMLALAYNS